MRIGFFEIKIIPASGPSAVRRIDTTGYEETSLSKVLEDSGLDLSKMQITAADGTPVDPMTLKLTGPAKRAASVPKRAPTRYFATERASGS